MKRSSLQLLLITVVTLLSHARTVDNYWIKDDLAIGNFVEGQEVSWELLKREFWPSYMKSEHYWRPIPLLPGYVESRFWGLNPAGYHIDNILMHALVAIVLLFLCNRLLGDNRGWPGFFAALLFALTPINAEAVVWVMQRMVLMCMMMSGLALLCWLNGIERRSMAWRAAALLFFALALLSKEVALTLPGLFFLLDFLHAPATEKFWPRFRRALLPVMPAALLIAVFFFCRYLMWGQVVNTYAGMDPWEYARANDVWSNFAASLTHGLVPVNAGMFPAAMARALRCAMVLCLGVALVRIPGLWRHNRSWRRLAVLALGTMVLGILPIAPIFWIDENLFNGRFFYQPAFGFFLLVGATLVPRSKSDGERPGLSDLVSRLALLVLTLALSISLGGSLVAFDRGAQQVRGLQQSLGRLHEDLVNREGGRPTLVVLYTPTQFQGVPTLEYSLTLAVKPPLYPKTVPVIPLLSRDFLTPGKWAAELGTIMERKSLSFSDLRWVECSSDPLGVRPLFGAPERPLGEAPCRPVNPPDYCFLSNDGPEPLFQFLAPPEAHSFRLRFRVRHLDFDWGPRLEVGTNCTRSRTGLVTFKPSNRDPSQPDLPDLWNKMMRRHLRHPVPLTWRVLSYDAQGKLLAISADAHLVILNAIPDDTGAIQVR